MPSSTRSDSIQINNDIQVSPKVFGLRFNQEFNHLISLAKVNEPRLHNPNNINDLVTASNSLNNLTNDLYTSQSIPIVRQFFDTIFTAHPAHHRSGNKGFAVRGVLYFDVTNAVDKQSFLFVQVKIAKTSPITMIKDLHANASHDNLDPNQNKFLINMHPNHMTFFIYQKNVMQNYTLKQTYAKDLVCIVWGANGIVPAPQTNDARLVAIPYNINHNQNSILTILNYMSTCSRVPNLRVDNNGAIHIETPPPMPGVVDQVKDLDAFNRVRNDGSIIGPSTTQAVQGTNVIQAVQAQAPNIPQTVQAPAQTSDTTQRSTRVSIASLLNSDNT